MGGGGGGGSELGGIICGRRPPTFCKGTLVRFVNYIAKYRVWTRTPGQPLRSASVYTHT